MNNNSIPGEYLRKELISKYYNEEFMQYFASQIINSIGNGAIKTVDTASKHVDIIIKQDGSTVLDLYDDIGDALSSAITVYAYDHLSKRAMGDFAELTYNMSTMFNAALTNTDGNNAILSIYL